MFCTFQPDMSPTAKSAIKGGARNGDIFERLYSKRDEAEVARERARQAALDECSFMPELLSRKTKAGRAMFKERDGTVFECLHEDSWNQHAAYALTAEEVQDLECTFAPQLISQTLGSSKPKAQLQASCTTFEPDLHSPLATCRGKRVELTESTTSLEGVTGSLEARVPPIAPIHAAEEGEDTQINRDPLEARDLPIAPTYAAEDGEGTQINSEPLEARDPPIAPLCSRGGRGHTDQQSAEYDVRVVPWRGYE
ncbi:unnamed protein product [Choristocarpus tenellus]